MIRKIVRESFDLDVDEAYVNNGPLVGEPYEKHEPYDYKEVHELDTELKLGEVDTTSSIQIFHIIHTPAYNNEQEEVIGHVDVIYREPAPYPIMKMIRINPDHQGNGYGKTIYEWLINRHGGLISDSSLTKRAGKGSYHIWQSLENDGYDISVIRWSELEDQKWWNPKKVKSIKGWVKHGKEAYRLVAEE